MKVVIVRSNQIQDDGHYTISYPDGRVVIFDIKDGRWDESKPAFMEIPQEEDEDEERIGVRQVPVKIVLESEQDQFEEYDDYRVYDV